MTEEEYRKKIEKKLEGLTGEERRRRLSTMLTQEIISLSSIIQR